MTDDLYFIPLLFAALAGGPGLVKRLRSAFRQIIELGKEPRFHRGYAQFLVFMTVVETCHRRDSDESGESAGPLIDGQDSHDMLHSGPVPDLTALLAELPEFDELQEALDEELAETSREKPPVELLLSRNSAPPLLIDLGCGESRKIEVPHLLPGRYDLSLATGMVIWEDELTKHDLFWAYALPDEPLRLAADTGDLPERPTRRIELLDGEIVLAVFPGREHGRMEVERCMR
jgi:hypothetical protein